MLLGSQFLRFCIILAISQLFKFCKFIVTLLVLQILFCMFH